MLGSELPSVPRSLPTPLHRGIPQWAWWSHPALVTLAPGSFLKMGYIGDYTGDYYRGY